MSINPPESGPALPDGAGTSPSATPGGAPDALGQAKADAGTVAANIAQGAVTGGATGAALGAVKGAVKTKTGRRVIAAAIAAPILTIALLAQVVFGAAQSNTAVPAGHAVVAETAALKSFGDKPADLKRVRDAASQTGVRWEILAAIQQTAKSRAAGGKGPFGLDIDKTAGEISDADAEDFDKAALYLGRKLAKANQGTVDALPNPALDAGYMDSRGAKGENVLKASDLEESKQARDELKKQYVAAIATLPLSGNPGAADAVFTRASNWAIGAADKCGSSTVTVGEPSSADLNAKKKEYAQAIIDQVAAKGMPEKAAIIALATALQESGLQMYWNSSVPGSKELSFGGPEGGFDLGAGRKSYSVGLFQQQVNGAEFSWGTVEDAMSPSKSADMFLERLMTISGWQDLPVTVAAQKVQISAFPSAYADDETAAKKLVDELKPTKGSYGTTTTKEPGLDASVPAAQSSCQSGGIGGVGTGVAGQGDDYPYRDPVGVFTDEADPWSLYKRQCVSFVAWRLNVQMGWKEGQEYPFTPAKIGVGLFGNAVQWKDTVGSKYKMDTTPKVGSVAWWTANWSSPTNITGDAGHVAIVSAVYPDKGTIDIEEYNFEPLAYDKRNIPIKDVTGFIHVADIEK
ncbi:CHAP domain-containing protein [Pseudarthrobacter chlorophenolicus]|nr:CHAP domain-containing protein [Pseudarthrobacter chlorophenolicus]SDQ17284.1 Surface antigen [Pseudarthrobacter chlorophenolicus]